MQMCRLECAGRGWGFFLPYFGFNLIIQTQIKLFEGVFLALWWGGTLQA